MQLKLTLINKLPLISKIFRNSWFWHILILPPSLLLFLFLVQLSPPRSQPAKAPANYLNPRPVAIPQPQREVFQKLVTSNLPGAKTENPQRHSPVTRKPQVNFQKHLAVKKADKPKYEVKAKPHPYIAPAIEIRVAIALDATNLAIGSETEAQILDAEGGLIQQLPPGQSFLTQPINSTIAIGDWQLPSSVWIEPTQGGAVFVGDRWYRGRLLLVSQGNTLLAVNHVDLEQYLASVVGSEISASEPMEALKAQAVAARSYAMVHLLRPANSLYDLGASQRWQVYKGLETEYNTTQAAVSETAGQILSYQGGVVESTYAATDEIVAKAHGGRGMSQTGAVELAAQGYEYQQILATYYPGAEVARLEVKP